MRETAKSGARFQGPDPRVVRQMFADIAPSYDFLNHFLSLSIDRRWRRRAVGFIASLEPDPADVCLDLCSGTGDLSIELHRRLNLQVVSSDFCHPMLSESRKKLRSAGLGDAVHLTEADALELPFADGSFRFVTIAFGLRNLESIEGGLQEMVRVLRPDGSLVILEFSRPVLPLFREFFGLYFRHILPRLGTMISGTEGPYQYLPSSVGRFPPQRELAALMESAGLSDVGFRNLTTGIAALHWGRRGR